MKVKKDFNRLFNQNWYLAWISFTLLSFYLSFIGGYGYVILIGLFVGIAQTVALGWINESKNSALWLINPLIWTVITYSYLTSEKYDQILWLLPLLLLPLNEILLWIIFRRFSRFIWTGINLIAYGSIYLVFKGINLLDTLELPANDAIQLILMFVAFAPYSLLSGYAIYLAYIKMNGIQPKQNANAGRVV